MKKCYIIAELSANHGSNINIVKKTLLAAKNSGADAMKIQTYKAESLVIDSEHEYATINDKKSIWNGKKLFDLYSEGALPYEWHEEIFEYAKSIDLEIFSTPFDLEGVDFLEELKVKKYKIASFEINDIPLIKKVASLGKPIIISTGVATLEDIELAIKTCQEADNDQITLLKCTSEYPAKVSDADLCMMIDMKQKFNVEIGLSDHSIGDFLPTVAVAMGATVIEKHFILDKSIGGPDASFSMEPKDFKKMVQKIRQVELAIGEVDYNKIKNSNSRYFMRSLFFTDSLKKGTIIDRTMIRSVRPNIGVPPKYFEELLGKKVQVDVIKGDPVAFEKVAD